MKALIRNPGETITQTDLPDLDWVNGLPLTSIEWAGGAYRLVDDYEAPRYDENGEPMVNDKDAEIAALKARLAALENDI